VVQRLKGDPATSNIPILQLSASFTDESDRAFGLESGADAYLTEPVEPELLLATIHALLRSKAAERVAERALQTRDEFLSITSHDIRGLLHALRLTLDVQLLRAQDRIGGGFADAPADADLDLLQQTAWDTYCMGRLERLGYDVRQPRRLYHFRNRHGFNDVVDRAFQRLWTSDALTWADITAICEETAALKAQAASA